MAGKWFAIREIRDAVLAEIEPYRADKTIGSSLGASPTIVVNDDYAKAIDGIDMAEVCITSEVKIEKGSALEVKFAKSEGEKCQRCWKILPEVTVNGEICNRCADAIDHKKATAIFTPLI